MKSFPSQRFCRFSVLVCLAALAFASSASAQPTFNKSFSPDTIGPGGVSTLTFDIVGGPVRNLAFVDNLPAEITIASPANAFSECGGSLSAPAGGSTITFSGGQVSGACSITVNVTSSDIGVHTNTTGDLTSDAGNSGTATADLTVVADRPGFSKAFSPSTVFFGGRSTLTFTIDNSASASAANSINFVDNLPAGMVIASPSNASHDCLGGSLTAPAGGSTITFAPDFFGQPGVGAGAVCTLTVDVLGNSVGELVNVSGELTSIPAGGFQTVSSGTASASLVVQFEEVTLAKSFIDDPTAPGETVDLEFTIRNLNRRNSVTDIAFTDDLDATLSGLVATGLPSAACGGTLSGSSVISLTGGSLSAGGTCVFSVTLQVPAAAASGSYPNTTTAITANVAGSPFTGNPASDILVVSPVPLFTKTFLDINTQLPDPVVGAGGQVDLVFSITNVSPTSTLSDITFTDVLTTFIPFPVSATLPATACGGSLFLQNITTDTQQLLLTGGSLAGGASCDFTVTLTVPVGIAAGTLVNTTSELTGTLDGETVTGGPATDSFQVVTAPFIAKEFLDDPATPGGTVTLQFRLTHDEDAGGDATNITFSDDLAATIAGLAAIGLPASDVCGIGSQITGTTNLVFSGGTLAPGETCSFDVTLQVPAGATPGSFSNTTSTVMADVLGVATTELAASDDLSIAGLNLTKEFIDDPALAGGNVTLRFTIDNISPTANATAISFTDNLDAGLDNLAAAAGNLPQNDICGTGSQLVGINADQFLILTGGMLAAGESCTFDVVLDVPLNAADGQYSNLTSAMTATIDGSGGVVFPAASDILVIDSNLLSISKEFTNDPVSPGGTVNLEFTIANLSSTDTISNIAFSDDLEAAFSGLVATGLPVAACGGTLSGTSVISLAGGSLAAGTSCTFAVSVTVPTGIPIGTEILNTTGDVTGEINGSPVNGGVATDLLQLNFLSFSKSFDGPAVAGSSAVLTFTIQNLNTSTSITGIEFDDDLNAALSGLVATGLPMTDVCGEESVISGTSFIDLADGRLLAGGSCTISVTVLIPASTPPGTYVNTTSDLRQFGTAVAPPTTATLTVGSEADLSLSKTDSQDPVNAGDALSYTLTVSNAGPSDAQDVVISDSLPVGVSLVSTTGCAEDPAGVPTCTVGTVAAGGSASVTVNVSVDGTTSGVITNTANVDSSTPDPAAENNAAMEETTVLALADLSITKTDSVDSVTAGTGLVYTITVANAGPSPAANVVVTDTLPAGVTLDSTSGCAEDPAAVPTCSLGTIAAGSSASYTVAVTVDASASGTLTNTASVTASTTEANPGDESASDTTAVVSEADLSLSKSDSSDPVTAGGTLTYTLTVANAGPSDAQDVVVTDTLPAGVTLSSTSGCGEDPAGVPTCTLGTIAAGGSASYTVTVSVDGTTAGVITNTASVASSTTDPSQANNSASEDTTVEASADLSITKSDSADPATAGDALTYTVTVANAGPSPAADVVVTDTLPAGVTLISTTGCSEDPAGVPTCSLGTIAAGSSASYTISVSVDGTTAGVITNTASVASSTADPDNGNNSANEDTTVEAAADLSISKTDSADPVTAGDGLTYTVTVANAGPSPAADVVVTDTLPAGVTLVSTTGCIEDPAGAPTCSLGTIAAGNSVSYAISVTVDASTSGVITNTASVASSTADPNAGDNTGSEDTTVVPGEADLSVTKTDSADPVQVGATLTYTIVVSNAGPAPATNVQAIDTLPPEVTFVATSGCLNDAVGVPTCDLGTIAAGSSASYTIDVVVNSTSSFVTGPIKSDKDSDSEDSDSGDSDSGDSDSEDSDSGDSEDSDSGDSDSGSDSDSDNGGGGDIIIVNNVSVTSDVTDPNPDNNSALADTLVQAGDADGDGISDDVDMCAATVIPESVPTSHLKNKRYALIDGDTVFDSTPNANTVYTLEDTGGCSCEQILDAEGLGNEQRKFGCRRSTIRDWVDDVEVEFNRSTAPTEIPTLDTIGLALLAGLILLAASRAMRRRQTPPAPRS